jgi:cellulose synthase (UDP-forming)
VIVLGRYTVLFVNIMTIVSIIFIFIGIIASLYAALILKHGTPLEYFFTLWFWFASVFFGIQSVTYFLSFRRSADSYKSTIEYGYINSLKGRVAILAPIFNEDP